MLASAQWLLLARGTLLTLGLTLAAAAVALPMAFAAGLLLLSRRRFVRLLATAYVEFWRGASAIVQLFVAFYVLPAFGILLPAFAVGAAVLGLNVGAYGAHVVRGAILGVEPGQREAASALGLRPAQAMRTVVLPQAVRAMLPSFGNEAVELLKLTAATSLITIEELSFASRTLVQGGADPGVVYGIELVLYFALAWPMMSATAALERRAAAPLARVALPG